MKKTYVLHPAQFKLDGGAMFGIIPKPLWEKKIPADEFNRIELALRLMYFETDSRKVLVDTGIGDYHGEKFEGQFAIEGTDSPLEALLLEKLKVKASDITDIIVSHLHFDHIGGLGKGVDPHVPVFPKANLHIHKKHYEYALNPTLRDAGSFHNHYFGPLIDWYESQGQVRWLEAEEGKLFDDVDFNLNYRVSFGHTPWMMHPFDDKFIYMADLVPMSHHITIPWVMGYDINPGQTVEYKEKFYEMIMKKNLSLVFEHDRIYWGGNLSVDEKNRFTLVNKQKSEGMVQKLD